MFLKESFGDFPCGPEDKGSSVVTAVVRVRCLARELPHIPGMAQKKIKESFVAGRIVSFRLKHWKRHLALLPGLNLDPEGESRKIKGFPLYLKSS